MTDFKFVYQITPHLSVAIDNFKRVVAVVDNEIIAPCRHALLVTMGDAQDKIQNAETADAAIAAVSDPDGETPSVPISDEWTVDNEMMVHASNLEAWVNNDYDPRLIHSNIARPILEKLAKVDERAKNRFLANLEELIGKGTKTLVSWAVEKYGDFVIDMLGSNVVLAAVLNNIDLLFENEKMKKRCDTYVCQDDFLNVVIFKEHGEQIHEVWGNLTAKARKMLIMRMTLEEIKVMFLEKDFNDLDLVDLVTVHVKISSYLKGLSFVEHRSIIYEYEGHLKTLKNYLMIKINHLDRMRKYRLSLQFRGVVENLMGEKPGAFALWEFAFKVVNAKEPAHVAKNAVFRVATVEALQRIKYKMRETTIQNEEEYGPFTAFLDFEDALSFMAREAGNCILLCLVKRTQAKKIWKKNPPNFTRNSGGGGYYAVSNGTSEVNFDHLTPKTVLCKKVIPIRVVVYKQNGSLFYYGKSKDFVNHSKEAVNHLEI
jgi:hypothetical protein